MTDRLTRWEGADENGPRAVFAKEGRFPDLLAEALRKLAEYEDKETPLLPPLGKFMTDEELGICIGHECLEFLKRLKEKREPPVEVHTTLYDAEELHENCTVQILSNSVTGDVSIGWWENDSDDLPPSTSSWDELFRDDE